MARLLLEYGADVDAGEDEVNSFIKNMRINLILCHVISLIPPL